MNEEQYKQQQVVNTTSNNAGRLQADIEFLVNLLEQSESHHNYCGWGDKWERECAGDLPDRIRQAIDKYKTK